MDYRAIDPEKGGAGMKRADFKRCGSGLGARCCVYLIVGREGARCARGTDLGKTIEERVADMVAQRRPTALYPECQLSDEELAGPSGFICKRGRS